MHKSVSSYRDGYNAHPAAEPETGQVTAAAFTPATRPTAPPGCRCLREAPGLEVLADAAYGGGETRAALTAAGHAQTIKPIPLRPAVPARAMHPRQGRQDGESASPRGGTHGSSPPGQLPPLAAHGRALDRLAGRQRPPPGAPPRPGPQPTRPVAAGGGDQPAPAGQDGAGPPRRRGVLA